MKKFNLISLLFTGLLFISAASAQQNYLGIIGGPNLSDLSMTDNNQREQDYILYLDDVPYCIGGVIGINLYKNNHIQLEPMYIEKGGIFRQEYNNPDVDLKLSYIEVPLLVKFSLVDDYQSVYSPYFILGPTVSFLISSEGEMQIPGTEITMKGDLKNIINKMDYGLTVGLGANFNIGIGTIIIETRYTIGLADIGRTGNIEFKSGEIVEVVAIEEDYKLGTSGIQFLAGMTFPFSIN